MSREVFECRACHRKVVEIVERLRGAHGPVAVRDGVDGDLVQPGSKGPPRVLVSGHGLQSLHEDLVCRLLLEKKKETGSSPCSSRRTAQHSLRRGSLSL